MTIQNRDKGERNQRTHLDNFLKELNFVLPSSSSAYQSTSPPVSPQVSSSSSPTPVVEKAEIQSTDVSFMKMIPPTPTNDSDDKNVSKSASPTSMAPTASLESPSFSEQLCVEGS